MRFLKSRFRIDVFCFLKDPGFWTLDLLGSSLNSGPFRVLLIRVLYYFGTGTPRNREPRTLNPPELSFDLCAP